MSPREWRLHDAVLYAAAVAIAVWLALGAPS